MGCTVVIMARSHCKSSSSSSGECRLSNGWPPTLRLSQLTWAASTPEIGSCLLHQPSPVIISTQPESRYSFYRPTEGERLSRLPYCTSHCVHTAITTNCMLADVLFRMQGRNAEYQYAESMVVGRVGMPKWVNWGPE